MAIRDLPKTPMEQIQGLLGPYISAIPVLGTTDAAIRAGKAAMSGNYSGAAEALADVIPVGRGVSRAVKAITKGKSAGDVGGLLNVGSVKDIENSWESRGIKGAISEKGDKITLSKIVVPQESRGTGLGKQAMAELLKYADANKKTVALTPSSDFGGNKSRLVDFYKGLGFEQNKGKSKDYEISESMLRRPQTLGIQAGGQESGLDPMRRNEADLLAFRGNIGTSNLLNINPLLGLLENP